MALETAVYISDLVATNPTGSDPLAFADDHLRLIKSTVKATFPNISGAVTKTHTEINNIPANTTSAIAAVQSDVDAVEAALTASIATKADKTTTVSAGTGLSGGGDLSANRTLAIANTGVAAGTYGSASAIPVVSVNAQGQVTAASTTALNIPMGAGSVDGNGGTFTAQTGSTGVCLIDVTGAVRAATANFGQGTFSISIGGVTVASDTSQTMEYDYGRLSGDHPRAVYKYTGVANSSVVVTVTYSGPGTFAGARYTYIGA